MRSGLFRRAFLPLIAAVALVPASPVVADAAQPTLYRLPEATHGRSLAVSPDGTVWFVPSRGEAWPGESESVIGSITPDGTVGEHEIAGFGQVAELTVGPTGEIWLSGYQGEYTETRLIQVGRLSASGNLEQIYAVGQGGSIGSIVTEDGAVWFVRELEDGHSAPELDRLTASGDIQQIPLPEGCGPQALAAGKSGVLWFTETCRAARYNKYLPPAYVDSIDSDGTIIRHHTAHGDTPDSITVGQDGTVWFGVSFRNPRLGFEEAKIGRITTAGTLSEHRVVGYPNSIAVTPDKRVWFHSWHGWRHPLLGSFSSSGHRERVCANPGCGLEPDDFVTAPDGSLWYSLTSPNLNEGGGQSGFEIERGISNESGLIAHLTP